MDFILMDSSLLYELSANKIYGNDLLRESKSMLMCRIGTLENASGTFPAQQRKATVTDVSWWCCGARTLKTLNKCTLLNILHIHPSGDCQNEDKENSSKHTPGGATTLSSMRGMGTS